MASPRACFAALVLLAGCSDQVVAIDPPPLDGLRSLLMLVERDGATTIYAISLDQPELNIPYGEEEALVMTALGYPFPLEELGLAPGRFQSLPKGDGRQAPVPERAWRIKLSGGPPTAWETIPAEVQLVLGLELPISQDLCDKFGAQFSVQNHNLNLTEDGTFAVPLSEEEVLIGLTSSTAQRLFQVTAQSAQEVQPSPFPSTYSAFKAVDGTLYTGGFFGELWARPPGGTFSRISTNPTGQALNKLTGPDSADVPFELFALSQDGNLERFDGGRWETAQPGRELSAGDVTWLSPGRVAFVSSRDRNVRIYDHADGSVEVINPGAGQVGLQSVRKIEHLGFVIGTEAGGVFVGDHNAQNWQKVGSFSAATATSIAPYGDGIMIGGSGGFIAQYSPSVGFCVTQIAPSAIAQVLPVGSSKEDLFLLQRYKPSLFSQPPESTFATWLQRVR